MHYQNIWLSIIGYWEKIKIGIENVFTVMGRTIRLTNTYLTLGCKIQ